MCRASFKFQYRVFEVEFKPAKVGWSVYLAPEVGIPVIPGFGAVGDTQDHALDELFEMLKDYYSAI